MLKEDKCLQRIMANSINYKLRFIGADMTKVMNLMRRGGKWNARTENEMFKLIFNPYEPPSGEPQGELSELQYEIDNRTGNACYGGDLGDLVYNSLRYNKKLLKPVFGIGAKIGFKEKQVIDCAIIKYRLRILYGKNPDIEKESLNAYLSNKPEPFDYQFARASRRIEDLLKRQESFRR